VIPDKVSRKPDQFQLVLFKKLLRVRFISVWGLL